MIIISTQWFIIAITFSIIQVWFIDIVFQKQTWVQLWWWWLLHWFHNWNFQMENIYDNANNSTTCICDNFPKVVYHNTALIVDGTCEEHLKFKHQCNWVCCTDVLIRDGKCNEFKKFKDILMLEIVIVSQ